MADERSEPTAEELAEQIRQIDVSELLLSTVSTLGQLAYVKLGADDLKQARLAIDGIAALLPTLEGNADEQLVRDLKQLLANVRLAFVSTGEAEREATAAPPPEQAAPPPEAQEPEPSEPEKPADEADGAG